MFYWLRYNYITVPAILKRWARENGLRIINKERRSFFRGPFFWTSSKSQVVYRVEAEDRRGTRRMGWVRIGGFFWPFSDKVEVRWDPFSSGPIRDDQRPTDGNPLMWDRDLDT
jgi:hypothetical protein